MGDHRRCADQQQPMPLDTPHWRLLSSRLITAVDSRVSAKAAALHRLDGIAYVNDILAIQGFEGRVHA